jgi:hypothetical protein
MITTDRLESFVNFMKERENIRIKKEAGQPWPWTDDPIFRQYKFTNVHRSDDRTTRAFKDLYAELWGASNTPPYNILYTCGICRYFGTIEFARDLKPETLLKHDPRELILVAGTRRRSGLKVFTSAYVITNGGRSEPKENVVADYLGGLWEHRQDIVEGMARDQLWEIGYSLLTRLPGFGGSGFMAKEVLQDFLMAYPKVMLLDRDTWTPMGPGGRRGMNRIHCRPLEFNQPEKKFIFECQELRREVNKAWPQDWVPLTAHDVQFQLCEFDKYRRVLQGEGQPKNKYVRRTP